MSDFFAAFVTYLVATAFARAYGEQDVVASWAEAIQVLALGAILIQGIASIFALFALAFKS